MARTILLNLDGWDLLVDAAGNIAVAETPYAEAQDAASAIKLFIGDYYYDVTEGVPYFSAIMGRAPPVNYMRQKFIEAAMTVPGVASANCFISSISGREVHGQVQITTVDGQAAVASF